jgi:hypothetical protein
MRLMMTFNIVLMIATYPILTGCAVVNAINAAKNTPVCTTTPYILPTTISLDHSDPNNSQQFTSGVSVPAGCMAVFYPALNWTVSNTVAAKITSTGLASCQATSSGIVVSSGSAGIPTATLTCQ